MYIEVPDTLPDIRRVTTDKQSHLELQDKKKD